MAKNIRNGNTPPGSLLGLPVQPQQVRVQEVLSSLFGQLKVKAEESFYKMRVFML